MTYVGKILVIVIMVFAVGFLFLSTMIFMTERDWKKEVDRLKGDLSKVKGQLTTADGEKAKLENDLAASKKDKDLAVQNLEGQITQLTGEVTTRQAEITDQRKAIETSQQNLRSSQANAEAKDRETALAREQLRAVQNEANAYKIQQTDLNDRIQILKRELDQSKESNKTLRDSVITLQSVIRQNGLDTDPAHYVKLRQPPDVDGEIVKGDGQNKRFEISIGSDDGLEPGHELYVWRDKPKAEYLGKVRVVSVDADQAVVSVVGSTPLGKKIQEGDIVSTKIRPRG